MSVRSRTQALTAGRRRVFDAMRAHRLEDIMTEHIATPTPPPVTESLNDILRTADVAELANKQLSLAPGR